MISPPPRTPACREDSQIKLIDAREEDWLRLIALELPPRRLRGLLEAFDHDTSRLLAADGSALRRIDPDLTSNQIERLRQIREADYARQLTWLAEHNARVVLDSDPDYPKNLREIPECPPALVARGTLCAEDKFAIAIVGSRRASAYGQSLARHFAKGLAEQGLTIISGGARGIDTQAHMGALDAGGRTLAFIGCGCDVDYPAENRKLFNMIAESGAVLSEFALGVRPEPWHFPARNRLISGASLGVVVVESPVDSGALITAREAGDQGRDVFAIPGPIDTGRNAGCHKLIQDGAKLVQTVDDILSELGVLTLRSPDAPAGLATKLPPPDLPVDQRRVLDLLGLEPKNVDNLLAHAGLSAPQISAVLTLLEMRGLARRVPGNAFVRVL